MQEIKLDKDFQFLLPVLYEETFAGMEENLLENGVRDALVLWGNVLIDGYNRYTIAKKHGLEFKTVSLEFGSREEVKMWIIKNQVRRRNLTQLQLSYFRGLHYNSEKQLRGGDRVSQEKAKAQSEPLLGSTANRLAGEYNVSRNTIKRDANLATALVKLGEVSPDAKWSILNGETKITKGKLKELASGADEYIAEVATSIDNGTFTTKSTGTSSDSDLSELLSLEQMFSRISNMFRTEVENLKKNYSSAELKSALRQHIDALEEMYSSM